MIPITIPMFWNIWKANQQTIPVAISVPNRSSARIAIRSARQSTHGEQHDDADAADEAELFGHDGVDEVGLLLGDEPTAVWVPWKRPAPKIEPDPTVIRAWLVL